MSAIVAAEAVGVFLGPPTNDADTYDQLAEVAGRSSRTVEFLANRVADISLFVVGGMAFESGMAANYTDDLIALSDDVVAVSDDIAEIYAASSPGAANGPLRFTQTTASPWFSEEGFFAGRRISDVADDLAAGVLSPADVPVEIVVKDGNRLVVNTRSSLALRQAGIPEGQWKIVDVTEDAVARARIAARLSNNGLDSQGADVIRITGSGGEASTYVGNGTIARPGE